MALISGKTIITSLSLFHITLGYFFLVNPGAIADQALVWILGESMGLPRIRTFDAQSPALAFLAVVLGFLGVTDLVSLSMPEEISMLYHWGTQAPLRLFVSMMLVLYSFLFSASSPLYRSSSGRPDAGPFSHPSAHVHNPDYIPSGWGGDGLKNRVFFAFAFVEMISWFWVWVTLREERVDLVRRTLKQQASGRRDD